MRPTQHLPPVTRFIAIRVVPAFVILVSAFFIVVGVQNTRLARASSTWPSVDGEIVRSDIVEERSTSGSAPRSLTYRPVVRYRYRVGDTEHEGERISLGEYATEDRADAEVVVETYPVGRTVSVYYRPGAPGTAVLERGSHGAPWLYAVLGGVFLLAGVFLAWVAPTLIAVAR